MQNNPNTTIQVNDELSERCQKNFQNFLEEFETNGTFIYRDEIMSLSRAERNTLSVDFRHVEIYNNELALIILDQFYRVYPALCQSLRNFASDHEVITANSKDLYISFTGVTTSSKVRQLTTTKIGQLIKMTGQVVRTHPVHPELVAGTFICLDCQTLIESVEQQFKYTQPSICRNAECSNRRKFQLEVSKSKFVDFQKLRIQETQAELPRGSIPRSLEVIVRAEMVEVAQAGDKCNFIGTLIVIPDVASISLPGARAETSGKAAAAGGASSDMEGARGLKALGVRDLNYRLAFLATAVEPCNRKVGVGGVVDELTVENFQETITASQWATIHTMSRSDPHIYSNLCASLFPNIYGNDEVKKGVLLMLFGGVGKTTEEGTHLRGDINVCVVGDPSTAKSQFLKQVDEFSPRSVYTSGKASTAAGLTAAVVKDEESFEFVIEAGALMLADNGVCCIDEFDKMDPKDQVAIHEAMEQQTISIAKAGVRATLNARTSILAAANPIGGKYDRAKPLRSNIALSAPIMSRFDLFFILVDECNEITDYAVAQRIIQLHTALDPAADRVSVVYSPDDVKRYITFARLFKPKIATEARDKIAQLYAQLRDRDAVGAARSAWRITVRQLESMVRLSEAVARLHCSATVQSKHVDEAYRLLNKSIIRVEQPDIHLDEDDAVMTSGAGVDADRRVPDAEMEADDVGGAGDAAPAEKALRITYEEYRRLASMLLFYMRRREEAVEDGTDEGVRRSELIAWYLERADEAEPMESEAEVERRQRTVERTIHRLVHNDNVIIELRSTGLKSATTTDEADDDDPILLVHPNYVDESDSRR